MGARGGGEACEQSVISGCSGRRRKRELGIAAPSPFPYFLSTGPRLHPAGEGPRAPPPTARQCAPGGARAGRCRLWRRPPLPPPPSRGSLRNRQQGRASFPPLAEAGAGSLGDEELPGRTRSPPIPGLLLGCGRWSRVPAEARPPPSSCSPPPGSGRSLGRSAHSARGTSAHPRLPQARRPWLLLPAAWAPASRVSADSQTYGAHSTGSRLPAPRFPPRHAAPASRGPDSPAQLSGSKAGPCPLPRVVYRQPPASAWDESPLPTSAGVPRPPWRPESPRAIHTPREAGHPLPQPRASPAARSPPGRVPPSPDEQAPASRVDSP